MGYNFISIIIVMSFVMLPSFSSAQWNQERNGHHNQEIENSQERWETTRREKWVEMDDARKRHESLERQGRASPQRIKEERDLFYQLRKEYHDFLDEARQPAEAEPVEEEIEEADEPEEAEGRAATIEGRGNNAISQYNACRQARQNIEGAACTGQAFAGPLVALANTIQANSGQYSMRELCKKAQSLNQQALVANGTTTYFCRKSLMDCVQKCRSAAGSLRTQAHTSANPQLIDAAYEAEEYAQNCTEQSQYFTQQGMLQAAQNVKAFTSSGECANILGGAETNELAANQIDCENFPPELQFVCENPTPENCSSPQHQNQPYCQSVQLPEIPSFDHVTPPGFCRENPQLCELDRGNVPTPGNSENSNRRTVDTFNIPPPPGFDPNALGLDDLDEPAPKYNGQPLGGGSGRSGGTGGGNNGLAGGGGGSLGGGGGAGGFGPDADEQDYGAGGDGIYDTDILKGVEGGIASAANAVRSFATKATGKAKNFIQDKFKGFNLKDYLPGKEKTPIREIAGQAATPADSQITPANGLSNFQKVSRMMREKRPFF